jgi:hypothetical protein
MASDTSDELKAIFEADQQDRRDQAWDRIRTEDSKRRLRVLELLGSGSVGSPDDYFHAAMVFQHGHPAGRLLASARTGHDGRGARSRAGEVVGRSRI